MRRHVLQAETRRGGVHPVAEKGKQLLPDFLVGDTFVDQPNQALAIIHRRAPLGAPPPRHHR